MGCFFSCFFSSHEIAEYEQERERSTASPQEIVEYEQERERSTASPQEIVEYQHQQERSIASPKLYDAFISHRGPDVKDTLAKQLYELLKARQCRAFLDRPEIEGGNSISSAISNGIRSSAVQIAIFSKGYAESSWCLDELVLMLEQTDALFIPVFYDVEPWELRHMENKKSQYAAAFSDYRRKDWNLSKLDEWKKALLSAAGISGYELKQHQDNLCEKIVSRVLQEKEKRIPLHVAKYPVVLAEIVEDFERCFGSETARDKVTIAGIYGLGGSGKTTLAKELFNRKSSGYSASCFLSNVRESRAYLGLPHLQSKLLEELFKENQEFRDVNAGIAQLKHRLGKARNWQFLIVLDDVNHQDQLDALLPEGMLSSGSLVIITSRDQSVLKRADIHYKMKKLKKDRAEELFCKHAFGGLDLPIAYEELVESFVEFCGGLPLSLNVLGAHLYDRNKYDWELELEKVKNIQPEDIIKSLKISFDGLQSHEKQIFIDIACFFNNPGFVETKRKAIQIWNASGWSAEHAVKTLQRKCLVEIDMDEEFEMHDHLCDLGRQMAEDLGPPRLWKPDSLRDMEAKGFKQILEETKARSFHLFRDSSLKSSISYFIGSLNDSAETELLWLNIGEDGELKSIPSWIPLGKLRCLEVLNMEEPLSTFQQQMQSNTQASFELRTLYISECHSLQNLPDFLGMFNHLEELYINDSFEKTSIESLVQFLQQLSNLRRLEVWESGVSLSGNLTLSRGRDSTNFEASTGSRMSRLESIDLRQLDISKLVISGEICPRLRSLEVRWMDNLNEMDLQQLERLNTLRVWGCDELETISGLSSVTLTGHQVSRLERIDIGACDELQSIEGLEELQGLKSLVIHVSEKADPGVWNCIYGLERLPSDHTILIGKAMDSSRLNVNLFSEVIGAQAVSRIEGGEIEKLEMRSSRGAITIYALLVTSSKYSPLVHETTGYRHFELPSVRERMVTAFLTTHNSSVSLSHLKLENGFMVTVNKNEEWKALNVLQIIVDRLYRQSRVRK